LATIGLVVSCGSSSHVEKQLAPRAGSGGVLGATGGRAGARSGGSGGKGASAGQAAPAGRSGAGLGGRQEAGRGGAETGGNAAGISGGGTNGGGGASGGLGAMGGLTGNGGEPESSGGQGGEGAGPLEPFVRAFCETARTCCEAAGMPLGALTVCETAFSGQYEVERFIAQGTVTVDTAALAACVAAYASSRASCKWSAVYAGCEGFLRGTVTDGQPCTEVVECDRNNGPKICLKLQDSADPNVGTCMTPAHAANGEACLAGCALDTDCSSTASNPDASLTTALCFEADGRFCRPGYGCEPIVEDGASCDSTEACGSGSMCSSSCQPLKADGESCQFIFDCEKHLTCDMGSCAAEPVASEYTCSGHPPFVR
jgi:hypothetical protein